MTRMARLVTAMKALLNAGTVIPAKPATADEVLAWSSHIERLGRLANARLRICCEQERERERLRLNKIVKRNKAVSTNYYAVLRRLPHMLPQWFHLHHCTDHCTKAEYQYTAIEDVLGD
jgi:hypothetical protein